jgi:hypothetical protein
MVNTNISYDFFLKKVIKSAGGEFIQIIDACYRSYKTFLIVINALVE